MSHSAEDRDRLSPTDILQWLRDGNARFCSDALHTHTYDREIADTATAQYPYATVLTCIDSRIPVGTIFDVDIGDLFVERVAGNYVDDAVLGGLEYTTAIAGAKLVVVMGHHACGAIEAVCDGVDEGHLGDVLRHIAPALDCVETDGERSSANASFVQAVSEANVHLTVEKVLRESEPIRDLVASGQALVIGAMYDLTTGVVDFYDPPTGGSAGAHRYEAAC